MKTIELPRVAGEFRSKYAITPRMRGVIASALRNLAPGQVAKSLVVHFADEVDNEQLKTAGIDPAVFPISNITVHLVGGEEIELELDD